MTLAKTDLHQFIHAVLNATYIGTQNSTVVDTTKKLIRTRIDKIVPKFHHLTDHG